MSTFTYKDATITPEKFCLPAVIRYVRDLNKNKIKIPPGCVITLWFREGGFAIEEINTEEDANNFKLWISDAKNAVWLTRIG